MMSKLMLCSSFLMASVSGHGLISFPKSREQICGVEVKPDHHDPRCDAAFEGDHQGGYNFMGVLTHTRGRHAEGPVRENVCGYNAEPWFGKATPWDKPIDWVTNKMESGRNEITWDIQWGNHFSDTEEFRYWITKPDFVYTVGKPLTWDDFEEENFCFLPYNDKNPNANPNVVPLHDQDLFKTYCNVPMRKGRHVIYGEWGRTEPTLERFHGCIDAMFSGGVGAVIPPTKPTAAPATGSCAKKISLHQGCRHAPNCCVSGAKCVKKNKWYSQCVHDFGTGPDPTKAPMATKQPPRYTRAPYTRPPIRTNAPSTGGTGGCTRNVPKWGNCHKQGSCCIGSSCKKVNPWYAQCL